MGSIQIVDLRWLRENYDPDDDEIRTLVGMFVERAGELIGDMRRALATGNAEAFGRGAHALRGISGTVRAERMFALLESSNNEAIAASIPALERSYSELCEFVARELGVGNQLVH